ncbi:MAG TPA: hypothetical protein IAB35_01430 [Candidatus Faecimonas gallistercoris]|nr:hypothetical protein [Candidatus Faecimonas gallistercoris]
MSRKGYSKKYIELLTEDGEIYIPLHTKNHKKDKLKKRILFGVSCLLLLFIIPVTYSSYYTESSSNPNFKVAPWKYRINASNDQEIIINLADTITENKYSMTTVVPGTRGAIPLEIDFSEAKVASDYVISLDTNVYHLPSNLKLYEDSDLTKEFQSISGSVLLDEEVVTRYIYWKWEYTTEDETESWANEELQIAFRIDLSQKIE